MGSVALVHIFLVCFWGFVFGCFFVVWYCWCMSVLSGGSGLSPVSDDVLLGLVGEGLSAVGVSERLGGLLSPEEVFVRVRGLLGGGGVWGVSELELVLLGRLFGVVGLLEERLRVDGAVGVASALVRGLEVCIRELGVLRARVEGSGLVLSDGLVGLVVGLVVGVVEEVVGVLGVGDEKLKSVGGVEGLLVSVLPGVVSVLSGVSGVSEVVVGGVGLVSAGGVRGLGVGVGDGGDVVVVDGVDDGEGSEGSEGSEVEGSGEIV